jgi:hypothetical protein
MKNSRMGRRVMFSSATHCIRQYLSHGGPILIAWMGLYLAAAAEQLEVETRFSNTGALSYYYWIGLEKSGNMYYWQDGTPVNNGFTSNADPVGGHDRLSSLCPQSAIRGCSRLLLTHIASMLELRTCSCRRSASNLIYLCALYHHNGKLWL